MNASFITIGATMSIGAWLARRRFRPGWTRETAVLLFTLAGIGVVMVGTFPENVHGARHILGAGITFLCGNAALVLFGVAFPSRASVTPFKVFSMLAGLAGLAGACLFASGVSLGLSDGGMEGVATYPIAIWQIVAGVRLASSREAEA